MTKDEIKKKIKAFCDKCNSHTYVTSITLENSKGYYSFLTYQLCRNCLEDLLNNFDVEDKESKENEGFIALF